MFLFTKGKKIATIGKRRKSGNLGIGYIERPWESALDRMKRREIQAVEYAIKALDNAILFEIYGIRKNVG
tara:strand:+ start:152 stop:361 length:210 start_codon:yes stop_codon:yes gene_type:complete